jgi:hypothetical protein
MQCPYDRLRQVGEPVPELVEGTLHKAGRFDRLSDRLQKRLAFSHPKSLFGIFCSLFSLMRRKTAEDAKNAEEEERVASFLCVSLRSLRLSNLHVCIHERY